MYIFKYSEVLSEFRYIIVLLLTTSDRHDCCSVQCLFINHEGKLDTAAFKHNSFIRHLEKSCLSAIYRAKQFIGELSEKEALYAILSKAIKDKPELGSEIWDCIYKYEHNQDYKCNGIEWELLRSMIGLQ